jgi:dihydroorotate dehydrogenase (NAD+) catalytic subunit
MAIDINTGKPVLSFKTGGVSGPAIRPVAVYSVYSIRKVTQLPILGVGGVSKPEHAIEMMMAGANAVGIGTGVYYGGIGVFGKVADGMQTFLDARGFSSVRQIVGMAHE